MRNPIRIFTGSDSHSFPKNLEKINQSHSICQRTKTIEIIKQIDITNSQFMVDF